MQGSRGTEIDCGRNNPGSSRAIVDRALYHLGDLFLIPAGSRVGEYPSLDDPWTLALTIKYCEAIHP